MKYLQKGFTLIELLIVIAVIGILAAVILAAIDPIDKIRAANDSKVQADIGQIAGAQERYATQQAAYAAMSTLVTGGELKSIPTKPAPAEYACPNYSEATYTVSGTTHYRYSCDLKSKKYSATPYWVYCTSTGQATAKAAVACP